MTASARSLALEKWQPESAPNEHLLFLLQLIGPDCHPDQLDLPNHLTNALKELLDTVSPDSLSLLNFTSPNGQLPEPGRFLLEADFAQPGSEPEHLILQTGPPIADEQPHHPHHHPHHRSALRKLLQGMNSHEPALMFLFEALPQHDPEAVHIQLSGLVVSGRLGNAIRDKGIKLSDVHLVAYEPELGSDLHDIGKQSLRRCCFGMCCYERHQFVVRACALIFMCCVNVSLTLHCRFC